MGSGKDRKAEKAAVDESAEGLPEVPQEPQPNLLDKGKPEALKGPVVVGGRLHLSPYDLLRYELNRLKKVVLEQEAELTKHEIEQLEQKFQRDMQAKKAKVAQASRVLAAQEKENEELRQEIGKLYNLNMDDMGYDMHSGRINIKGKDILV